MEKKNPRVLVPINDTKTSRSVIEYIIDMQSLSRKWQLCLIHIFRLPTSSEELMGKKFTEKQPARMRAMLECARDKLIQSGFLPERVDLKNVKTAYTSVSDGIIEQYRKENCDLIILGRKKKSKAEEFVMGDLSIKLIRKIEKAAVLVVTI